MKKGEMDDLLGLEYPIRGIKNTEGEWEYGSISLDEAEELKTSFLFRAFALYGDWQTFGVLPHGGGTLDERSTYLQAMKILKEEENGWQQMEMEKDRAK